LIGLSLNAGLTFHEPFLHRDVDTPEPKRLRANDKERSCARNTNERAFLNGSDNDAESETQFRQEHLARTKKTTPFAKLPQHLAQCPGGIGLTTAMTMLKSGWVIVGSTPSTDGTTRTRGEGCLVVLDSNGEFVTAWAGPNISGPWGNIVTVDDGATATIFVSMAGFNIPGPEVCAGRQADLS
jgi:hypothetical protein